MVVLGGGAFSYERGTPVGPTQALPRWGCIHGGRVGEREFFIDNLLVRIHLIIVMILVDRVGSNNKALVSQAIKVLAVLAVIIKVLSLKRELASRVRACTYRGTSLIRKRPPPRTIPGP